MCVLKVIILWALVQVPATDVHGLTSEQNVACTTETRNVLRKTDLQNSTTLNNQTNLAIQGYLEDFDKKLSHQENLSEALLSAVIQMSQDCTMLQSKPIDKKSHQEQLLEELLLTVNKLIQNINTKEIELKTDHHSLDKKLSRAIEVISNLSKTIGQNMSFIEQQHEKMQNDMHLLESNNNLLLFLSRSGLELENTVFLSCKQNPSNHSGKYIIQPIAYDQPFQGYCEQTTFGGGWLVFQYRFNGSVDFYRDWADYRDGFGSLDGEFWLGLEHLHQLTSNRPHELLVEMKDFNGSYSYARYSVFEIGSEKQGYPIIKLGSYSGTAGDSFTGKGRKFATKDRDNHNNCAVWYRGAWWYFNCTQANLNGIYNNITDERSIFWYKLHNHVTGLAYSRIMIREIRF